MTKDCVDEKMPELSPGAQEMQILEKMNKQTPKQERQPPQDNRWTSPFLATPLKSRELFYKIRSRPTEP